MKIIEIGQLEAKISLIMLTLGLASIGRILIFRTTIPFSGCLSRKKVIAHSYRKVHGLHFCTGVFDKTVRFRLKSKIPKYLSFDLE